MYFFFLHSKWKIVYYKELYRSADHRTLFILHVQFLVFSPEDPPEDRDRFKFLNRKPPDTKKNPPTVIQNRLKIRQTARVN